MTSINVKDLEDLITHLKTATEPLDASVLTVIEGMRNETRDLAESLMNVSRKIDLEHLQGLEGLGLDTLPQGDQLSQSKKNQALQSPKIANWLIATCNTAAEKLRHHNTILNSLLQLHDKDIKDIKSHVSKVEDEVKKVEKEVARVEVETDEARQRGMKGNLIITSSTRDNKTSVFTNKEVEKEGVMKKEDNLDMILRVVKEKTGVNFKPSEVAACHPLGRRQEAAGGAQGGQEQVRKHPHSWILRIWDRKPGSNWEILKTGMKYGKGFDEKYNLNVSYMLTQKRSKLSLRAREVKSKLNSERKLKKDEVVFKYSFDENGQMTVKSQPGRGASFWKKVDSIQELNSLVLNTYYNQN